MGYVLFGACIRDGCASVGAMPASRIAARSALQVILRSKHDVGTFVVVILAGYECRWPGRRLGRIILHTLFSQASLTKFAQAAKKFCGL
jgi:hypothetical protein